MGSGGPEPSRESNDSRERQPREGLPREAIAWHHARSMRNGSKALSLGGSLVVPFVVLSAWVGCGAPPAEAPAAAPVDSTPPECGGGTSCQPPVGKDAAPQTSALPSATSANKYSDKNLLDYIPEKKTEGASIQLSIPAVTGMTVTDAINPVEGARPQWTSCYQAVLSKKGAPSGSTTLSIAVDAHGKVKKVSMGENTTGDKGLAKCLEKTLRGLAWPPGAAAASATIQWEVQSQ